MTVAAPSTPWGWTPVPGTRASTAACAAGSAPCQPPPPPATASGPADQRPRWRLPSAATGCGRSREGWEQEEVPPPENSTPPEEPRNRSPNHETRAANHAAQTCLTVHCIYYSPQSPLVVTRSLHSQSPSARERDPTPNEKLSPTRREQTEKNLNRERRPVNLNLISRTPPLNRAVAPNLRASRSVAHTLERERARVVLTRERRFNESLFNGASCLFIIKSGAVFAPPSPLRSAPAKNYCATNNKLEWQSLRVRIIAEGSPVIYVTNIILIDTALDLLRNKTPIELETSAEGPARGRS